MRQDFKEKAATFRANGDKVQFVHQLTDLEMRDYQAAKKLCDAQDAQRQKEEEQDEKQRCQKLKAI